MLRGGNRCSASLHISLFVRINGDLAFFKGVMKEMLEEDARRPGQVLDRAFIDGHSSGFAELRASVEAASWTELVAQSGVTREQIQSAARVAMEAKSIICCWAMGLTQHRNSVATIREVANFLFLRGNIGRPGAGACPVRGHSNVQGDRTMGIFEKMPPAFLDRLGAEFHFEPPRHEGFDTVNALRAMHDGRHRADRHGGNSSAAPTLTSLPKPAPLRSQQVISTKRTQPSGRGPRKG